jgi:hypothetical protein
LGQGAFPTPLDDQPRTEKLIAGIVRLRVDEGDSAGDYVVKGTFGADEPGDWTLAHEVAKGAAKKAVKSKGRSGMTHQRRGAGLQTAIMCNHFLSYCLFRP